MRQQGLLSLTPKSTTVWTGGAGNDVRVTFARDDVDTLLAEIAALMPKKTSALAKLARMLRGAGR
jgi:hypothetical protein